ncbi:DUF7563 family protein [Halorarius litoreus]|uniref:DUF7563 family protein n=1 Tax=Halorarius litoreus TaxID=2962676 RepID=UPI0020CE18EE|nr:hypothetical protein [Halorarius litoreus]
MSECMSCGGFVSDDYARVFGDNEDNVFDCRNCRTDRRRSAKEEEDDGEQVLLRSVRGTDEAYSTGRGSPTATTDDDTAAESAMDDDATADDGSVEPATAERPSTDAGGQSGLGRLLSVFRA